MKEYREVLQFGTFYRLKSPFEGNETVWMVYNGPHSVDTPNRQLGHFLR